MKSLSVLKTTEKDPDEVRDEILTNVVEPLSRWDYQLSGGSDRVLIFKRSYFPAWTIVVSILLFPVGLLALLFGQANAILTFSIKETEKETEVSIEGRADKKISDAIETMQI